VQEAAVNLFIAAYLTFAWLWAMPGGSPLRRLIEPVAKYVRWLGLWHSWNMFVPDPTRTNRYLEAEVRLASGAVATWRACRLCELRPVRAFLSKRHRKFQLNVVRNHYHVIRPALCDYLARQLARPDDPAVEVRLLYCFQEVPGPGVILPADAPFARTVLHRRDVAAAGPDGPGPDALSR
jgi:hypothetical protein